MLAFTFLVWVASMDRESLANRVEVEARRTIQTAPLIRGYFKVPPLPKQFVCRKILKKRMGSAA